MKVKRKRMLFWTAIAVGVVALWTLTTVLLSWRRPELGAVDGRLRPCPRTPNCVCSDAGDEQHRVEPFPVTESEEPLNRVKQVMVDLPRATLVEEGEGYVRYECVTSLLHYVDDVEFLLDRDSGVIHVRSASRVGQSDLGKNRRRVEEIRRRYDAAE